jgi:hypothetical protein
MQTRGRVVRDAGQHVGKPRLWIDIVEAACCDEGEHDGSTICPTLGAGEGPVAATKCHCPFILPMPVRNWKFIIVGIRILAARSTFGG